MTNTDDAFTDSGESSERTLIASRVDLTFARRTSLHPYLLISNGWGALERTVEVQRDLVIGRGPVDLQLEEASLSRRHARVSFLPDRSVEIEDLGSRNGTYVNGERLAGKRRLRDGDRVQIGRATQLELKLRDDQEAARLQRLYDEATRDGLTGALNKRAFGQALTHEVQIAQRSRKPLSLAMFDGDHFKRINDDFGHPAGDQVLKTLTQTLAATVRREDILVRWGGEEFAVLMRGVSLGAAVQSAERLRLAVEQTRFVVGRRLIPFTVSVGVGSFEHDVQVGPDELIAAADRCLYQAKTSGRNRVCGAKATP